MASSTICLPGTASSTPSINPKPRTSFTKPCLRARSFSLTWKYPPTSCMCGSRPSRMSDLNGQFHAQHQPETADFLYEAVLARQIVQLDVEVSAHFLYVWQQALQDVRSERPVPRPASTRNRGLPLRSRACAPDRSA